MTDGDLGSLGRYRLLRRLGRGGMAEVFEARATGAAGVVKQVCVKRILPSYVRDPRFVGMFVDEARVSMALHHGAVAQVFDFGREGDELFLAMELVDGQSLHAAHRRLRERGYRFPVPHALHVTLEILAALHHAHTCTDAEGRLLGIVHRDVSPQNVLLSYEGQVKLVDFGIARAALVVERGSGAKGKLPYMAPEQARRSHAVDARADVFGAGALLFELLAGRTPLEGGGAPAIHALVSGELPRLSEVAPWVDPALAEIVDLALAPEPDERWPTALAFREALADYVHHHELRTSEDEVGALVRFLFAEELAAEGRSAEVRPAFAKLLTPFRGAPERSRRGGALWALGAGSLLLALVALAGLLLFGLGPDVRSVLVRSRPSGARVLLDGRDTGVITDGMLAEVPAAGAHELTFVLRGFETVRASLVPGQQAVAVVLPLRAPPAAAPPPPAPTPPDEAPPLSVREAGDGRLRVEVASGAASLPMARLPVLWRELDPGKRYTLTAKGAVTVMAFREVGKLPWLALDREGRFLGWGLQDGGHPTTLPSGSARVGYVFLEARSCADNSGAIRTTLRADDGAVLRDRVDGVLNCGAVEMLRPAMVLDGLEPDRSYRVRYPAGDGPRLLLVGRAESVYGLVREANDAVFAVGPGETASFRFVTRFWMATLDPADGSASASLRFEPGPSVTGGR